MQKRASLAEAFKNKPFLKQNMALSYGLVIRFSVLILPWNHDIYLQFAV